MKLRFMIVFFVLNGICAAYADDVRSSANNTSYIPTVAADNVISHNDIGPQNAPESGTPLISINSTSHLDMNWAAVMEHVDPALRPAAIILPLLEGYPIDALEVKLRLLNMRF